MMTSSTSPGSTPARSNTARMTGATMLGALNERGETLLMPYAAGPAELSGSVDVIRCLPPDPDGGTA